MALSLIALKAIICISIFVVSLIFAIIPSIFNIKNQKLRARLLSIGNAFAGGVFLGGGFCHLLPEASKSFEEIGISSLPLAFILAVSGFLLVFLLEKVIFLEHSHDGGHEHSHLPMLPQEEPSNVISLEMEEPTTRISSESQRGLRSEEESNQVALADDTNEQQQKGPFGSQSGPTIQVVKTHPQPKKPLVSKLMPIILTLVLSIHSVIAGFTIGVQVSSSEALALFVAVISHKWTESFALGVTLVKSKITSKMEIFKYLSVYSMMAPLGLILGAVLSVVVSGKAQVTVNAVVSGIASGTFIYIALVDILLREFTVPQDKWIKYLLCCIGFGLITASILLFDED